MIISEDNSIRNSIVDRIKIATPIIMGMFTLLIERLFFKDIVGIFSLKWLYLTIAIFITNTSIFAVLIYNYARLYHSCKNCLTRWSLIKSNTIYVSNTIYKVNIIFRYLLFKIDKSFQTYTCTKCDHIQNKPRKKLELIGIVTSDTRDN